VNDYYLYVFKCILSFNRILYPACNISP